jgi:hypothetical protein
MREFSSCVESVLCSLAFVPDRSLVIEFLVYGVGRHLAIHQLDAPAPIGNEPLTQSMTFLMRSFIDRPATTPVCLALGGPGTGTGGGSSGGAVAEIVRPTGGVNPQTWSIESHHRVECKTARSPTERAPRERSIPG